MTQRISFLAMLIALTSLAPGLWADGPTDLPQAAAGASADVAGYQRRLLERALAEAQVVKGVMEECLSLVYFPGMFQLREDAVAVEAGRGEAYRAVSARRAFLRGAPGARIVLRPSDRSAQFEALKADYRKVLERAGSAQRALGEHRQLLWALAEWGSETIVSSDGKDYVQILTREERDRILAP
ncbi:MAG: hypothetical protein NTX64_02385 [Elusimicrobia bacterium]|nr:hypothetical protein [Elusimicrobiota bacterium]